MDVWSRSSRTATLGEKARRCRRVGVMRVRWRTAFARGGSSYALERNPSTVRSAASLSGRAVD